jgi:hypothetical protein
MKTRENKVFESVGPKLSEKEVEQGEKCEWYGTALRKAARRPNWFLAPSTPRSWLRNWLIVDSITSQVGIGAVIGEAY